MLTMPLPAAGVGAMEPGISAGLTFDAAGRLFPVVGFDLAYHYWPASPGFKDDFDALLQGRGQAIDAATWAFSAFQATLHVKVAAPVSRRFSPWIKAGAGAYLVDRNLTGLVAMARVTTAPGAYGSIGVDVPVSPRVTLGLDGTCHRLWSKDDLGSDFVALEAGAHVLFGF